MINQRRPTTVLLSPVSSNNESYSSNTSASSSNYITDPNSDSNSDSHTFDNKTIGSIILPATLIAENDIVDHLLYPSPDKIISNTDGTYGVDSRNDVIDMNTLFIENTLSIKTAVHDGQQIQKQEDADEIWV